MIAFTKSKEIAKINRSNHQLKITISSETNILLVIFSVFWLLGWNLGGKEIITITKDVLGIERKIFGIGF
ncbi:MAG: hypothetical protein KAX49_13165 [Halanaerobiales bacterium]|nr:hypothetical protein [Halanaerobiales bacterium]